MNIIEAIKSGKRFKRAKNSVWIGPKEAQDLVRNIDYASLLADDWEVEEKKITITESAFEDAWDRAYQTSRLYDSQGRVYLFKSLVARELGLWKFT